MDGIRLNCYKNWINGTKNVRKVVFQKKEANFDWIYQVNNYVNPNTVSRRDIKLKISHWTKLFDAGKKVGFIYGIDKPRVIGLNGKYYIKFVDMMDDLPT